MDGERLAVELASRMHEAVPVGLSVGADADMLWFLIEGKRCGGSYACRWPKNGQDSVEDLTIRACELALNDLQDFVTEKTAEPWPATEGRPPRPVVCLVGRAIEMWFGSRDHPVARLRPLALDG
jgi:hypothetical protein